MRRGTALHTAAEAFAETKKESGKELAEEELIEIAIDKLEGSIEGVVDIDTDPELENSKETVRQLVSGWNQHVAPTIGPIQGVEEYLQAKVTYGGEEYTVEGYVDLIDANPETGELRVRDWKTGKTFSPSTYENGLQLPMYSLLARANGFETDAVRIDHLRVLKSGVKHEGLELRRGHQHHIQVARMVARVDQYSKSGAFVPNPTGWACNPGCDFWSDCPFRKPDLEVS